MKIPKPKGCLQALILALTINCASYLNMSYPSTNSPSNATDSISCGSDIEYISDSYKQLESTFPIAKEAAKDYVESKLPRMEEYLTSRIDLLEEDTVWIFLAYQSDERAVVSSFRSVSDTSSMKTEMTKIIGAQSLDSSTGYCVSIELNAIKTNGMVHIHLRDINYSSVSGRKKAGIMRTVMQNLAQMRHEYNRILRKYPGVKGKLTMKFIIDENGQIIYLKVIESSLKNCQLENNEVNIVKEWDFDATEKKPNLTTVVYPFVFAQ